jgi:hypothetical protein
VTKPQRRRAWRALVPVLLLLPLGGCAACLLRIEVPGFGDGTVEGVWLWRLSTATGQYERSSRLVFSAPAVAPDGETVDFEQQCANGSPGTRASATVEPSPSDPSTATLSLYYTSCDGLPGTYRASAYNEAGESALSSTTLVF